MVTTEKKVTVSSMIREEIAKHPAYTDTQIETILHGRGVEGERRSLISVVRSAMKKGKRTSSSHGPKPKAKHGGARRGSGRKSRVRSDGRGEGDWAKARAFLEKHPGSTPREIVEATGVVPQAAYQARTAMKLAARKAKRNAMQQAYRNGHARNGHAGGFSIRLGDSIELTAEGLSLKEGRKSRLISWEGLSALQALAGGSN